ncbi:MAG: recombinase family protein, partial [Patescibacteria group bacterium]|nr:recombinase family protein [Patescibacteria group bacterium]
MNQNTSDKSAFAYIRVSSERQTEGMSLEEQARQTKLFAERRDLEIMKQFTEVDSASELNRPIFRAMLEEFKKSGVKHLIFHSVDRSARNPFDQAKIYELIQQGFTFHFVAENLSTDNPTARSMILIMYNFIVTR